MDDKTIALLPNYQALAASIVHMAMLDYNKAFKTGDQAGITAGEHFFLSDRFMLFMPNTDGETLMEYCRQKNAHLRAAPNYVKHSYKPGPAEDDDWGGDQECF